MQTQLAKYEEDMKKPSTRIPSAQERLEKDRKKAAQFKEQMPLVMADRITSYNVCYTKLLRRFPSI